MAALWFEQHRFSKAEFTNDRAGFRKLGTWLKRHGVGLLRVALESTSTYAEALAQWLHEAGHQVHLLNPERTAHYARSLGRRNKTDPADTVTLAVFIAVHTATPWHPPAPEQKTLRSLTRVRQQLTQQNLQVANQLRTADATAAVHLRVIAQAVRQHSGQGQNFRRHPRRPLPQIAPHPHRSAPLSNRLRPSLISPQKNLNQDWIYPQAILRRDNLRLLANYGVSGR